MEGPNFIESIPKFTSPEDELSFLRARVAEQEKTLQERGVTKSPEAIAAETIEAYKKTDSKEVLHTSQQSSPSEQEALVLALKPETHDKVMEEVFGYLHEKGIKNALEMVAKMHNPHVDDDFHRFLVQYLVATKSIPGLKESNPIFKGVNMVLFEVTLPDVRKEGEEKNFKEFLSAMEQFFAGMQGVALDRNNTDNNYYTLEIALSHDVTDVIIYAAIPTKKASLFEKQVLGFYQDAKLRQITDDYNIFVDGGVSVGSIGYLEEPDILPLKMFDKFEHDPMNAILNSFSKLSKEGEGASIQFIVMPAGEQHIRRFNDIFYEIKHGKSVKRAYESHGSFARHFMEVGKELVVGPKSSKVMEEKKERNEKYVEYIQEKLKSSIVEVGVRIIASAQNTERAKDIRSELESAFNQFEEANSNSIHFKHVSEGRHLEELLHAYSYRLPVENEMMAISLKELTALFHFPINNKATPQLKQSRAQIAPAPSNMPSEGITLGINDYRGTISEVHMAREDRVRHLYVIGQTGTGKTTILKNMIVQDIINGDGVCFIDPHGSDIQDILANIPKERIDDVIYFDPAHIPRPMGLNMLEYDIKYPEQKTFVVNELISIFNKLFDMKTAGGPAFEQYFRNSALLVMEDPDSGSTLLEIGRVLADKDFRDLKLSRCKNPIIKQFWDNAEKTSGEQSLANFVPYVTNKFDVFVSNDIMRPIIAQDKSVFNFRDIMDNKKILLVNLSKGRLGDINSNLIGLILVGKLTMAALSRVDILGTGKPVNDFYLYIDEFQNVTTDSIATILSEARKYRLSLNIAHQYISQLEDSIKNAVFGNVGSMAVFRVGVDDTEFLAKQFEPIFSPEDILKLENYNCYMKMLVKGMPEKPFNIKTLPPPKGNPAIVEKMKELSYLKFGRPREEVEDEIMERYKQQFM